MQHPRFLLDSLKETVTTCRRVSSAPIVLGGAGYSIFPKPALTYLQADMGIKGEGEAAFPALLNWIERGARDPRPPELTCATGFVRLRLLCQTLMLSSTRA